MYNNTVKTGFNEILINLRSLISVGKILCKMLIIMTSADTVHFRNDSEKTVMTYMYTYHAWQPVQS